MRPLTIAVAAALAVAVAAPVQAAPAPTSYLIKPTGPASDAVFPEGVAAQGRTFYVGSTTDGTIYRGNLARPAAKPFLRGGAGGRTSAIGLKVDHGNLFVAGGATGRFFIYDIDSRDRVGAFRVGSPPVSATAPTFLNDEVVAPDGSVYVTDSVRPVLYRIGPKGYETDGVRKLKVFRDFTGSALEYTDGFNVNGIAVSADGKFLVLAKSNTSDLFRVRVSDGQVRRIDLGGETVSGDGLVLTGRTLYAVERVGDLGQVVKIRLSDRLRSGTVVRRVTNPGFDDPTTAAIAKGRLLVVNSQFGEQAAGETPDPFTVSSIPLP